MDKAFFNHLRDKISEIITHFIVSTAGVKAVLVSSNGFEITSKSMDSVDMDRISTVASTLSAVGNMAVVEVDGGDVYQSLVIQSKSGFLLVMNIFYEQYPITFCVITTKKVVIAQITQSAKKVVDKITQVLFDLSAANNLAAERQI